ESLDRLSRQEPMRAFRQFCEIVEARIEIHTLTDGKIYSQSPDVGDLLISIVNMSRAHEESRVKSYRLRAAWQNKRDRVTERKLTAKCAAGAGNYSITKRLNSEGVVPFGCS